MKPSHLIFTLLFAASTAVYSGSSTTSDSASNTETLLKNARELFYKSVQSENKIDQAIDQFKRIAQQDSEYVGVAQTYIGALTALRAKYSFWPYEKLKWARKGLSTMDQGIQKNPDNLEALFIHGSTCYYLPFFFNRGEDAQWAFQKIIDLYPSQKHQYEPQLLLNMIEFILGHAELSKDEREKTQQFRQHLKQQMVTSRSPRNETDKTTAL
jgi:hypothetical protein